MTMSNRKQIVVCAACKYAGLTLCGARHWDKVMSSQYHNLTIKPPGSKFEQGFIDQFGTFLTRKEAFKIVEENGQPFNAERNGGVDGTLYNEGLY